MVANRTKTIEYAWASDTKQKNISSQLVNASQFISSNCRMDILENTDRTFTSAYIVWGIRDNSSVANYNTISSCRIGLYISGTTGSTWYLFNDKIAETDENITLNLVTDVTPWFTSNYTGTSQTIGCITQFANSGSAGNKKAISGSCAFAKAVITYDYNDIAQSMRTKTVRIPITSEKSALLTSFIIIDNTNGIPALDTFLPESNKTYKDIFFEFWSNEGTSSTTDSYLVLKLDNESTAWSSAKLEKALNSACTPCFIWKRLDIDTSIAHTISAKSAGATAFDNFGGILTVTYTYDNDNSSSIMNSLQLPVIDESGYVDGVTSTFSSCYRREIYIEEPGPISIKQSGFFLTLNTAAGATFYVSSMGQKQTAYVINAAGQMAGFNALVHSLTSGNKIALHRGKNNIELNTYANASGRLNNFNGVLLLNYTSGKHNNGDGVHNHTIHQIISGSQLDNDYFYPYKYSTQILESNYYMNSYGFINYCMNRTAVYTYGLEGKNLDNENDGLGWETYGTGLYVSDGETSNLLNFIRAGKCFKKYPKDANKYQEIESSRDYRYYTNSITLNPSLINIYTYHSISSLISGTMSRYSGDGSDIQVDLFECSTNNYLTSTMTTTNGKYSIIWYDNDWGVYTSAYENSTHVGRSDKGDAV